MDNKITVVTGLFDIGRGNLIGDFRRPWETYLGWFQFLLERPFFMVIFCEESLNPFIWENREIHDTFIVNKSLDYFKELPFYNKIQNIRNGSWNYEDIRWLRDTPQSGLELYNPLVMSKQLWMSEISQLNPFNSDYFIWVDAGAANTTNMRLFDSIFEEKIISWLDKPLYLPFPYRQYSAHGFKMTDMDRIVNTDVTTIVRATLFGEKLEDIEWMTSLYESLLTETLNLGLMGTEENIFTLMLYENPDKYNLYLLDDNPRIQKFLEGIR